MYAIVSFGPVCSSPSSVQPLPQPGSSAFRCRTTPRVHMPVRSGTPPQSEHPPSSCPLGGRNRGRPCARARRIHPSGLLCTRRRRSWSPRDRTTPRFHPSVYASRPVATRTSSPTAILCGGGGVTGLPLTILCNVYGPVNPCMSRIICIAHCTAGTESSPAPPSVKLLPLSMSSKTCTPSLSLYTSRYVAPPGDIASAAHCFLCVFQSFFWHSLQQ